MARRYSVDYGEWPFFRSASFISIQNALPLARSSNPRLLPLALSVSGVRYSETAAPTSITKTQLKTFSMSLPKMLCALLDQGDTESSFTLNLCKIFGYQDLTEDRAELPTSCRDTIASASIPSRECLGWYLSAC